MGLLVGMVFLVPSPLVMTLARAPLEPEAASRQENGPHACRIMPCQKRTGERAREHVKEADR